jgi:ADP-ribose pyrophosphatase YjhB (NUDIX family)
MRDMTTDRRFARFNAGRSIVSGRPDTGALTTREVPEGGMCLSAFIVITETGSRDRVLLGRLNPEAPWDHIGALDRERVEAPFFRGWMIPSRHLVLGESPHEAARRILKEQLELESLPLSEPKVVSETYTPKTFPDLPSHWDLEFIFRGELSAEALPRASAWRELAFIDTRRISRSEIARSQEDVLESVGFRFSEDHASAGKRGNRRQA